MFEKDLSGEHVSKFLGKAKPAGAGGPTPGQATVLQRRCACGRSSPTGVCQTCQPARLAFGSAGDAYEQEAHRLADGVVRGRDWRMPAKDAPTMTAAPLAQRRIPPRAAMGSGVVPPIVIDTLASAGTPLEGTTRTFFERRFGQDFSHVGVHADARAADSSRAMNAIAYTIGSDIVFDAGQYAPGTRAGDWLLAHELAHVGQQARAGAPALQRLSRTQSPTAWSFAGAHRTVEPATYERLLAGVAPERAALQMEAESAVDPAPVLRDLVRLTALELMAAYRSRMIAARASLRDPAAGRAAIGATRGAARKILDLDETRRDLERSLYMLNGLTQSVSPFSEEWANTIAGATSVHVNADIEAALETFEDREAEMFAESKESIGWVLAIDLRRARTKQIRRTTDQINAIYKEVPYLTQFYLRDPLAEEAASFVGDPTGDLVEGVQSAARWGASITERADVFGLMATTRQYASETMQSGVSALAGPTLEQFANGTFGSDAAYLGQVRAAYDQLIENIDNAIELIGSDAINPFTLPEAVAVAGERSPALRKQLDALRQRAELMALARTLGLTVLEAAVALMPVVGPTIALAANLYASVHEFQETLEERALAKAAPSPEGTLGKKGPSTGQVLASGAAVGVSAVVGMAHFGAPRGDARAELGEIAPAGPPPPPRIAGPTLAPEVTRGTAGPTLVPESTPRTRTAAPTLVPEAAPPTSSPTRAPQAPPRASAPAGPESTRPTTTPTLVPEGTAATPVPRSTRRRTVPTQIPGLPRSTGPLAPEAAPRATGPMPASETTAPSTRPTLVPGATPGTAASTLAPQTEEMRLGARGETLAPRSGAPESSPFVSGSEEQYVYDSGPLTGEDVAGPKRSGRTASESEVLPSGPIAPSRRPEAGAQIPDAVPGAEAHSGVPYLAEYEDVPLNLSKKPDEGLFKEGYPIPGTDLFIAIVKLPMRGALKPELEALKALEARGFPIVEVVGTTTYRGREALVMRRYAAGSRPIIYEGQALDVLNARTLKDLQSIKRTMLEQEIDIPDLQFLVANDGRVVINDPGGMPIPVPGGPAEISFEHLHRLMETTLEQILRRGMKPGEWHTHDSLLRIVDTPVEAPFMKQFLQKATHSGVGFMTLGPDDTYMIKPGSTE